MYDLVTSPPFERKLKQFLRKHPELKTKVLQTFELLQHDPATPSLKTHGLTNKLKGRLAASITYEYRIVFSIDGHDIYLLTIGTHDEVY